MSATETLPAWNLETLVDGKGADGVKSQLKEADELAAKFAESYRGKVSSLDSQELVTAMTQLETITDLVGRAGSYASLKFAEDTSVPEAGALMAYVQEQATATQTKLLFFELEWTACDDSALQLLDSENADRFRHYLTTSRRYRPHQLTEPEEQIVSEKQVTGSSAWERLFEELMSAVTVDLSGITAEETSESGAAEVPLDVALSMLADPNRDLRANVAERVTSALEPGLRTRAYVYNTLLADKATDDRLRHFDSWISSRNLSNEASDSSVETLIDSVRGAYDIPQRWYKLKAQHIGVEKLKDYDRMAALIDGPERDYSWEEATKIVYESFDDFSPQLRMIAEEFVNENWIDVPVRPGKRGGAFCAYTVPSHHPYVLLNWTGKRRDVLTLAHELGHGIHAYLARDRGVFEQGTPLTLAETASVFAETLVFEKLLAQATDPAERLGLLSEQIEGSIATIFRQVAMNRFEDSVHSARRNEGELSVERFAELWTNAQTEMLGESVEVTDGYRSWWSYIPHFIGSPGYVYAYAYGQLMALSVYGQYRQQGPSFAADYIKLLAAGGSLPPDQLVAIAGLDLNDPAFWQQGLQLVNQQLQQAEEAAAAVKG